MTPGCTIRWTEGGANDAAHNLLRKKAARGKFRLAGETYSPASYNPCENENFHKDNIEFYFLEG